MTELSAEKLAELREIAESASMGRWRNEVPVDAAGVPIAWTGGVDEECFLAFDPPTVLALFDRIAELETETIKVRAFINERPDYITALKNTRASEGLDDYYRWAGHAEARRQLAQELGLTVPHEPGETTKRIEGQDD